MSKGISDNQIVADGDNQIVADGTFQKKPSETDRLIDIDHPPMRYDQPYTDQIESQLKEWQSEALELSHKHNLKGYSHKRNYIGLSIPTLLTSVVMSGLSGSIDQIPGGQWVSMAGFIIIGTLSGVNTFYNFAAKAEKNFQHENLFGALASDIDEELTKSRQFRSPADVVLARTKMKRDNLIRTAPLL